MITTRHDQIYDKAFRASLDLISPNRILSSHYTQRRITYSSNFADASCMCRVYRYTWWSPGSSTRGCWTAPNPPSSSRSHSIHSRIMSRTIMAEITYKNVRFCLYKVHCNQACLKKTALSLSFFRSEITYKIDAFGMYTARANLMLWKM